MSSGPSSARSRSRPPPATGAATGRSSGCWSGGLGRVELGEDLLPHDLAEDFLELLHLSVADPLGAAEMGDQQLAAARTDTGQLVELAAERVGGAAAAVARDREAMRLVAD